MGVGWTSTFSASTTVTTGAASAGLFSVADFFFSQGLWIAFGGGANSTGGAGRAARPAAAVASARQSMEGRWDSEGPVGAAGAVEVLIELGRVGHRIGRAVGDQHAMADEPNLRDAAPGLLRQPSQQQLQQPQGQPAARLAVTGYGKADPAELSQGGDGAVAVEDLDQEQPQQ